MGFTYGKNLPFQGANSFLVVIHCVFFFKQINLDPLLETASPARKKRKRQLGFADAETQIPKALLKRNFTNTEDITENFVGSFLGAL